MSYFGTGMDIMFSIVPIIIFVGFIIVFGLIISAAIKGSKQWNKNNNSPRLTVEAKVVAKRMSVKRRHTHNHNNDMNMGFDSTSTDYYVTFEVQSGDRMELFVPDSEYGMLVEGDIGNLTFQGTRYQGFIRI